MAAGMGSRFGGLKQITPVDTDGNFLIDYSLYDARRAGFTKVIFIIKKENYEVFKETLGKRVESKIQVEYAFQDILDVPSFVDIPISRIKPWGTVHAILSAKHLIDSPFVIINADDFYGYSSYQVVADFLNKYVSHVAIPYPFCNVSSKFGMVKRGVLSLKDDFVDDIVECNVGYEENKVRAIPLNGDPSFFIEDTHPVSMNMFGFQKEILKDMEEYFVSFMKENLNHLESCECLIPEFLEKYLKMGKICLSYRVSSGLWLGMTYKEDLVEVQEKLVLLKKEGVYPEHLWEDVL